MQRRARIKAVANLSSTRRAATKTKTESRSDPIASSQEPDTLAQIGSTSEDVDLDKTVPLPNPALQNSPRKAADATRNYKVEIEATPKAEQISTNASLPHQVLSKQECNAFKAPLQMPRIENDANLPSHQLPGKIRRFKIAPRLNCRSFHRPKVLLVFGYNIIFVNALQTSTF
jgi:hypothetical protein